MRQASKRIPDSAEKTVRDIRRATRADWCQEAITASASEPLTGIIASHATKKGFPAGLVASIEQIAGTPWWQALQLPILP
jgi:hypothetical protein